MNYPLVAVLIIYTRENGPDLILIQILAMYDIPEGAKQIL